MPFFLRFIAPGKSVSAKAVFDPSWGVFLDTVPAMIWVADSRGRVLFANAAWREATGIRGKLGELADLVHPEDQERLGASGAVPSGGSTSFEFRLRRADGEFRWVLEQIRPWYDGKGAHLGFIGSGVDIHEQRRHERRLSLIALRQTSLACFGRFIVEKSDMAVVAAEAVRLFCEHLAFQAGFLIRPGVEESMVPAIVCARGLPDGVVPVLLPFPASGMPRHFPEDAEGFPVDAEWLAADGWRHGLAVPVDPTAPELGWFVGLSREAPDAPPSLIYARDLLSIFAVAEARQRAERDLRAGSERALLIQKMEAVGLLAGGVAHDFNNLLTAIRCIAELLREDLPDEAQRSRADDILHAASRAGHLVRQLLAFSRHEVVQPEPVDLQTLVDNLRGFIRSLLSEHIRIDFALGEQPAWCQADPKQVEQVLFNLCLNARDVMIVEGTLRVSVGPGPVSAAGAKQVRLSVADTGPGVPPHVAGRLFQPFFTTKPRGRGTGLGLAASRSIARGFGGDLTFETEAGRGTVFHLDLPELSNPYGMGSESAPAAPASGRKCSILLVEDDDLVRTITRLLAESFGHKVVPFGDAWAEQGGLDTVDLAMTDIVMPGMSGHALAKRLRRLRPDLPLLYMSGYVDDEETRAAIGQPGVAFLAKPFSNHEFANRIELALASVSRDTP
jgi:PAS domain S-box-containing protein